MTTSRREFLQRAAWAGTALAAAPGMGRAAEPAAAEVKSPNEKLNVAVIGVANRGGANLGGVSGENVVALCDVDALHLAAAKAKHPHAETCADFRRVFDRKDLDAVVISTPDHTHFHPAYTALKLGLPTYCEKPLAHSVREVRQLTDLANKHKIVTQMGTQIHAGDNYRRAVEIVQAGLLGPVTRVHVWLAGGMRVFGEAPISDPPAAVNYDLWLGPAPERPFSTAHFHFNWRYWWDFGNGALGDFGCHYMDLPFWALNLKYPESVQAEGTKGHEGLNECPLDLKVDYKFPARGTEPPVHLTWYQGRYLPEEFRAYGNGKRSAVLFEGSKGRLLADYGSLKIFSDAEIAPPPQSIPKSIGHHAEFLRAIRTQGPTTCNFGYSGPLAEAVLLGNVSYRAGNRLLEWDAETLKIRNDSAAEQYLRREYRKGWEIA